MMTNLSIITLKRGLLLFWVLWLTVVCTTNGLDGLKAVGLLGAGWKITSGNYALIVQTTAIVSAAAWMNALLFLGVILWEGTAAVLFWRAWQSFRGRLSRNLRPMHTAFAVGLALWTAFVIVDEVLIAYAIDAVHMRIFIAQLGTYLAICLVPEDGPSFAC